MVGEKFLNGKKVVKNGVYEQKFLSCLNDTSRKENFNNWKNGIKSLAPGVRQKSDISERRSKG